MPHILGVDDEEGIRRSLAGILGDEGFATSAVDARAIAVANCDLPTQIAAGRHQEDLYYRLDVLPFPIPRLRERSGGIPILARAFVAEFCAGAGARCKELTPRALAQLESHRWPGNVCELRNLMERLVSMTPGEVIDAHDLPPTAGENADGRTLEVELG